MENGTWVKDETYQGDTITWSSSDVEAAAKKPSVEMGPTITLDSTKEGPDGTNVFLFKNLKMYAPNGQKYYYRVVEKLDNMHYEAALKNGDVAENEFDSIFVNDNKPQPDATELVTDAFEPIANINWSNGSDGSEESDGNVKPEALTPRATFGDRYPEDETITLEVTKEWIDNNDALELRPDVDQFAKSLKVYRKADGQGGTGGAGAISEEEIIDEVTITAETSQDANQYTYTITGKDSKGLEKIAPNGMPWIYIVRENLRGTSYVVKQGTTTELSEFATSAGEDNILDLGVLSNTLTTSQSFQKQWQNHNGGSITEDYLGLGDITITGQLWVGVKGGDMEPASKYFTGEAWDKWFTDGYWETEAGKNIKANDFQIDLMTQLGNNDQTETISNLPRVNSDRTELAYAIVETKIEVADPSYTQTFTWEWENEKLTVTSQDPLNGLFTPQEITVGGSTTIINNRLQTTNLSGEKLWKGDENETNLRPTSIDVVVQRKVQQKGGNQSEQADELTRSALMAPRTVDNEWEIVKDSLTNEPLTLTLDVSNNWQQTIPNLPTYGVQGNVLVTYSYRIRELKQGWTPDTIEDSILDADEKYNGHYTVSSYDEDGSTLTVTNTLTHMDITAVKAWKPEGLHGNYAEVTFTLQSRVVGSGDDAWKDVVDADGKRLSKKLTGEEDPAWTVTWTELPRTENGQTLEYRVVEKLADGLKEEEHVQFSITPETISSESADKTFTFTVTNIPLGQITVTKEDGDGNGLAGVEFTLKSDSSTPTTQVNKTGEDGKLTFTNLPLYGEDGNAITYTLTETSTPNGYIQLTEEINVSFTAADQPNGGIYWETTDGEYLLHKVEYEVVNGQYFPVVHTGGSGFYWPGVLGAGAAAAGVLYLIRRKTKGHNTER